MIAIMNLFKFGRVLPLVVVGEAPESELSFALLVDRVIEQGLSDPQVALADGQHERLVDDLDVERAAAFQHQVLDDLEVLILGGNLDKWVVFKTNLERISKVVIYQFPNMSNTKSDIINILYQRITF